MNKYGEGTLMKFYRVERFFYTHHLKAISKAVYYIMQILFNCVIPPSVMIGTGTCFAHGVGIVIHHDTVIGKNVKIYQNVTIGNPGVQIGDNCFIGSGAVLLGPCKLGNNCKVGANAVVNFDVPSNSTVVGSKSIIINQKDTAK